MCQYESYLKIDNLLNKKDFFRNDIGLIKSQSKQLDVNKGFPNIMNKMNDGCVDNNSVSLPDNKEKNSRTLKKREIKHRTVISDEQRSILKSWLYSHYNYPYPTQEEKNSLMLLTGLNQGQINNWFVNIRRRDFAIHPWSNSRKSTSHRGSESFQDVQKPNSSYFGI